MSEKITFRGELEDLIARDPFSRFTLVTVAGERYLIEDRSEIVLSDDTITLVPVGRLGHTVIRFNTLSALDALVPV